MYGCGSVGYIEQEDSPNWQQNPSHHGISICALLDVLKQGFANLDGKYNYMGNFKNTIDSFAPYQVIFLQVAQMESRDLELKNLQVIVKMSQIY